MLRTFGLELTSLVNSDPAWKVPKGSRSASRRARKPVCERLKKCTGLINRSSGSSNMPVSGSEKRGASMLDCRFSEKAEHVPIKKRRFLLRSPSPPPPVISSQCTEETVSLTKSLDDSNKHAAVESASPDISLGKIIDKKISLHDNKSEKANKGFGEGEDFSGISILAAAACSSSLGRESGYAEDGSGAEESSAQVRAHEVSTVTEAHLPTRGILKEDHVNSCEVSTCATSSCVSTEPVGELASISPTVNSSQNITAGKGAKEVSLNVGSVILSGDVSCSKDEDRVGSEKLCSKDDRFHWDLNVVMDAWEHPFESPMEKNDVPPNLSQDAGKGSHDDSAEGSGHDLQFKLATTCATQTLVVPGEPRTLAYQSLEEKVDHDTGNCRDVSQPSYLDEKPLLSYCKKNTDAVKRMGQDSKLMSYNRFTKCIDGSVDTTLDPAIHSSALVTMDQDDNVSGKSLKLYGDAHLNGRSILQGLNLSTGGCTLENLRSACASNDMQPSLSVSSCSEFQMEVKPNLAVLKNMKTTQELQFYGNSLAEKGEMKTEPLGHPCVTSDVNYLSHSSCSEVPNSTSAKCEFLVASDAAVHGVGVFKGEKFVCGADTTVKLSEISVQSKETCESVDRGTCRANLDKSFNQNSGEKVCSRPLSVVGTQEGYDSQYEDGEVRELNEHPWEVEHVDYESEDMETCTTNPTGYLVSKSGQVEVRENRGPGEAAGVSSSACNLDNEVAGEAAKPVRDDGVREEDNKVELNPQSEEKTKASVSKELLVGRSCSSDMDTGVSDDDGGKVRLASHTDGLVDSKATETRIESKPFRRGLQSRIEGPVANDSSSREGRLNKVENRYEESSSMRSFERPRYSFHNQARGRQSDNSDGFPDNRRGFRRHYSPIMHRNSKQDDDTITERDDIGYNGVQDDVSYSHQLHPKSRSGGNEDDSFHPRCKPNRAFSPGRPGAFGRGRSIRYGSLGDNRGGRGGRYNGPSPDDSFQSSLKYRRPLSRRERSFSPFGGRGGLNAHHSRGKSPSQSRSRSPVMWNSPRGRPGVGSGGSTFLRHRSRSPNFGSDMRMQRLRPQQSGFAPDDTAGFRSMPRSRGSPPHGRWNSGGKEEGGHFREFGYKQRTSNLERSPGRTRFRGDRAGVFDPPRNLKPDGYYRVSEDAACRGGPRYEENFEGRRKYYGPLRPARRSYEDGMVGRLHQDVDDSFSMPKGVRDNRDGPDFQGRGRGMDSRMSDFPRRFRGGEQSFMCERDGKFNSTSKQFGGDGMDSSHNLKSEEQYRSSHNGRFTDMDGVNRGRRYDNFEERRKQYGPPNLMKRGDTDGSEKRLNHNLDENFQDNPDFCGRGMRSFDGRVGGLSTRLREDKESTGCGQEMKLEDNPQ